MTARREWPRPAIEIIPEGAEMKNYGFGARLRETRLRKGISLRRMAELIDVSSTYLSQVEQGKYSPLTASRMVRVADVFDEDAEYWIGLAGRIPDDMEPIIRQHPTMMPKLIRLAGQLPDQELSEAINDLQSRLNRSQALVDA